MLVAVVLPDTAVIIPGIKPDADTNSRTELSQVLTTKSPTPPTYNPPATNPNCGLSPFAFAKSEPVIGLTLTPPVNCGLAMYEF